MSIRFLADENFNGKILRGVRRERPDADVLRVQDTALRQAPDPDVLAWAAQEGRIVLSHDIETMVGFAYERLAAGLAMPGLIVARESLSIRQVIEDLLTILDASDMSDWDALVTYLPL